MIIKIFTGPLNYNIQSLYTKEENEYLIGVDAANLLLIKHNIPIDLAVGDFDSVTNDEKKMIMDVAKKVELYDSTKDYTDTNLALEIALQKSFDKIVIYGGLGKRTDHTLANIFLLRKNKIELIDDYTKMYVLKPGKYDIKNGYKYISFFATKTVEHLSIKGFKYELDHFTLAKNDPLCISNKGEGTVRFDKGELLVIHQNE